MRESSYKTELPLSLHISLMPATLGQEMASPPNEQLQVPVRVFLGFTEPLWNLFSSRETEQ